MNNKSKTLSVKGIRNHKDTLFRMIFKDPKELLSLYNALNDTSYTDPADLEIVTLENAIYMNVKNDLACVIDCHLNLYEHQSTVNPNMPLRDLIYVAKEYEKLFTDSTLYSVKQVKIPTPSFIVFYNGTATQPERLERKLSDAFEIPVAHPALELKVIQININSGFNKELMDKCRTLQEYTLYVERVRKYAKTRPLTEAVEQAVQECIKENILAKFLRKHRAEAISMSIFEYDEEREMALIRQSMRELEREEGREEGRQEGLAEGRAVGRAEGRAVGRAEGRAEGITAFVSLCKELNLAQDDILRKLQTTFSLTDEDAKKYLQ